MLFATNEFTASTTFVPPLRLGPPESPKQVPPLVERSLLNSSARGTPRATCAVGKRSGGSLRELLPFRLGGVVRETTDQHALDPVAPAGGGLGHEAQAVSLDMGAGDRDATEMLGHQAEHRVDVVVLDVEAEELVEVVDREARRHPHR